MQALLVNIVTTFELLLKTGFIFVSDLVPYLRQKLIFLTLKPDQNSFTEHEIISSILRTEQVIIYVENGLSFKREETVTHGKINYLLVPFVQQDTRGHMLNRSQWTDLTKC